MAGDVKTVLPQGAGYGVVVGIGFFFAGLMMGISYIQVKGNRWSSPYLKIRRENHICSKCVADNSFVQNRYTAYSTNSSEEFNAASRNVKAGMIVGVPLHG